MQPKPSKNRSRRARKKLHLGEFQVLGFEVNFTVHPQIDMDNIEAMFDDFISQAVEANHLRCGGGGGSHSFGFFVENSIGSATQADRQAVDRWLSSRDEIATHEVGMLVDAWYSQTDEAGQAGR